MNKIKKSICTVVVLLLLITLIPMSPLFSVPVNAATSDISFVDVNSRTYTIGTGKITILVFGRPTCGNCHATIFGLAEAEWIKSNDVQIVFADIDGNVTSVIQQFRDEVDCDRIMFCSQEQSVAGDYNRLMWSRLSASGSVTLPVIVYFDKQGNQVDVSTGYQSSDSILQYAVKAGFESDLSITSQPVSYSGAEGSVATFKVKASGIGLKYKWQTKSSDTWKNSSMTGAKTNTLSVPVTQARDGYKFRCVITDALGNKVISKTVTLNVVIPLSITSQSKDYTGPEGSTAKLKVVAEGTGLKYQWQTYKSGKWVNSSLTGATTSTLSVPVTKSRDGYKFRCVVTDAYGKKVTSKVITLNVLSSDVLAIITQPKSFTGPVGSTATFKVKAQGKGLKYQWQTYKNGKWTNSSLTGSKTATLSVPVTKARDGYKFRCVITDAKGKTLASKSVTLKVG